MAFKLFKGKKGPKACVIGLDGVPYSMLTKFMAEGVMPATRDIMQQGTLKDMTVCLPEISSVSWTSFMTGRNPGEHGIYGFTDLKPNSYDMRFPSFKDVQTDTMWDRLGEKGLKSVVINQPSTYPAREIPGALISGFVAIDMDKSVYPKRYLASLARTRYRVDIDTEKSREDTSYLFKDLSSLLDIRRNIMDELWSKEDWNLMEVIVTGTDRLHHFQWDAYEDENHPYHEAFLNYYREVDAFVAHTWEKYVKDAGNDNFFMLSDHGFCGTKKEVYVNSVLEKHGFLKRDTNQDGLESITSDATAFALDPARIYIHRKGKYPRGAVEEKDVAGIKAEIRACFEQEEDDGVKFVRRIFDNSEAYHGPVADQGPDLCLVPVNGYDMKGRIGADTVTGERRLQGMHTWDDAFFFSRRSDLVTEDALTIFDVTAKVEGSLNDG